MDKTEPAHHNHAHDITDQSPRKPISGVGGDRLKRDEWSEGAVATLLEAYETKWVLRNRAKLKGHDWDDVARQVSSRAHSSKSPKTLTQCKNKIESMKKRYRSESASDGASSWPLYPRLDLLLRGTAQPVAVAVAHPPPPAPAEAELAHRSLILVDLPHAATQPPSSAAQNSRGSNGADQGIVKADGVGTKLSDHLSDKNAVETNSSTPAVYIEKESPRLEKTAEDKSKKKRRKQQWEIAESIRWLAEVMVRSEQARMETMKELERMRLEAEAKRGELDLKRTEIIANTQLEIARLIAGKGIDSSLRIGRN